MSENKNTLAKGMFVREHTFSNGTKVFNVAINVADFCSFVKDNMNEGSNDSQWINLKLIPNKNIGENKLSHTPILDDYIKPNAEQALQSLAAEVLTPSAEERAITETPTKKTRKKASKKVTADDLPF